MSNTYTVNSVKPIIMAEKIKGLHTNTEAQYPKSPISNPQWVHWFYHTTKPDESNIYSFADTSKLPN